MTDIVDTIIRDARLLQYVPRPPETEICFLVSEEQYEELKEQTRQLSWYKSEPIVDVRIMGFRVRPR